MRRRAAPTRNILPDPLFGSELIAKFINHVMEDGKKSVAEKIVYGSLAIVLLRHRSKSESDIKPEEQKDSASNQTIHESEKARERALALFEQVLDAVRPHVEVKSRRVGGATYQVPVEVRPERRMALAMRWLVEFSNKRNEKTMILKLANEMLDALQGRGGTVKRRSDVHQMAKANQAFAHFKW